MAPLPLHNFMLFPKLPVEIRLMIWGLVGDSAPERVPEVCILWPFSLEVMSSDQPHQPFVVDTAWPSLMHACRESREVALRSKNLRLRFSPLAGFAVPFRNFDPEIDTLHWGFYQVWSMFSMFRREENRPLIQSLRHMSLETAALFNPRELFYFITLATPFLRTLAFVFADSSNQNHAKTIFKPPARRCRLRDIPDEVANGMTIRGTPHYGQQGQSVQTSLRRFMELRREELEGSCPQPRLMLTLPYEGTAWDNKQKKLHELQIKAQTFVEYEWTQAKGVQWLEVCGHRRLGNQEELRPRYIPAMERKNPEEYRVLDDESGWLPPENPNRPPPLDGEGSEA
ncbi:hypothetical protein MMYC01_208889 [Madurella mycetomatis]|uniref:2EXR domain-containing protein n=1 Tax=Madurella mycetomatis TaxID=100816 RepID=A0A175VTS4_9PEZI|nr:hypothetical protein MMYC01_208889 [Madurella mycetomatis]